VALVPGLPVMRWLVAVQVLNGALLPVMLFFVLRLAGDGELMGDLANSRVHRVLGWGTFVLVSAAWRCSAAAPRRLSRRLPRPDRERPFSERGAMNRRGSSVPPRCSARRRRSLVARSRCGTPPQTVGASRGQHSTSAADAPIDTSRLLMMENRSFDHHLGADASAYLEKPQPIRARLSGQRQQSACIPQAEERVSRRHLTGRAATETNLHRGAIGPTSATAGTPAAPNATADSSRGSGNDEYPWPAPPTTCPSTLRLTRRFPR
jgi:hypothetical protein